MEFLKKNKGIIILLVGIIGIAGLNWKKIIPAKPATPTEYSETMLILTDDEFNNLDTIQVDVKGEVNYPGLYEVACDLRVGEIISVAGGITSEADLSEINLAERLVDEMIIAIPKKTDTTTILIPEDIVKIVVVVKGEINNPGIYYLSKNSRIGDLIFVAGGITTEADLSEINLAEKLTDEMVITIPKKTEITTGLVPKDIVKIIVEIKGEIVNPGIYYLNKNSRVNELILLAGGKTQAADLSGIELARVLSDGETITIPERIEDAPEIIEEIPREIYVEIMGEVIHPGTYLVFEDYTIKDLIYEAGGVTVNCDLSKINWNLTLCLGAKIYIPSYEDEIDEVNEEEINGLININTANLELLITLPGIGDIIGQRIIDYRSEFGDFLSIEEIVKVSGIKDSIYENIKEFITV
ncbi:SLBB domain-containing protein [Mycoplasmatota bacterium WC30]